MNVTSNFLHRTSFSLGEELIDTQPEHVPNTGKIDTVTEGATEPVTVITIPALENPTKVKTTPITNPPVALKPNRESDDEVFFKDGSTEKRGTLTCHGKEVDSEIIYWRKVRGDRHYESPITPHHDLHHDRYLTFEYDHGGKLRKI